MPCLALFVQVFFVIFSCDGSWVGQSFPVDSVHTIDCQYADHSWVACAYLVVEDGRATFIETNTTHAVPLLLTKLEELGIPREKVDYVIITHVHLDHAGGASALLQACPNAKLLAHPKAARHMVHPERLIESSKLVYGEEPFMKLYGQIDPIEESRVKVMLDGETLSWGKRNFTFLYTRGHANHHFCIFDSQTNAIFTGDSFGIAYPKLEGGRQFIFPTTTPTDFHAEEAQRSLDLIVNTGATCAYLTHFGGIENLKAHAKFLSKGIVLSQSAILEAKKMDSDGYQFTKEELRLFFESKVKDMISQLANEQKVNITAKDWKMLDLDVKLNAQGLLFAFQRNT
jgi:glyoxylase-like metal-dependent hydrolase (beta-lactamase superfamily II)